MANSKRMISARAGLQAIDSPLDATSFFNGLALAGVMEKRKYLSTTGSGEEKYYWRIKKSWLHIGANRETMHAFKTDPVFDPEAIPSLLVTACECLLVQAKAIQEKG